MASATATSPSRFTLPDPVAGWIYLRSLPRLSPRVPLTLWLADSTEVWETAVYRFVDRAQARIPAGEIIEFLRWRLREARLGQGEFWFAS